MIHYTKVSHRRGDWYTTKSQHFEAEKQSYGILIGLLGFRLLALLSSSFIGNSAVNSSCAKPSPSPHVLAMSRNPILPLHKHPAMEGNTGRIFVPVFKTQSA